MHYNIAYNKYEIEISQSEEQLLLGQSYPNNATRAINIQDNSGGLEI